MSQWRVEDWTTLIASVTSAIAAIGAVIVSIINALRGRRIEEIGNRVEQKVDEHEVRAEQRSQNR